MKRLLALLLSVCLFLPLFSALPISAKVPVLPVTLTLGLPAVKADVGEVVDLSLYSVTADDRSVLKAKDITWTSSEIEIADGKVTPTAKGLYRLTATVGSTSKTVYLLVKETIDTEYVLFEETFDGISSFDELITAGYETPQMAATAKISIKDGKLILSGQAHTDCYIRLLFPAWLGDFGDYRIEATAAMTARLADSNWMAFMYRVQNNDYPYYQNTFRANTKASNGIEVAERNPADTWEVIYKQAHTAAINDGVSTPAYHDFAVEAFGNNASSIIDGTVVAKDIDIPEYDRGRIGLQIRAAEMTLDRYRVVIPANGDVVDVNDPDSDIIAAPSMIQPIESATALTALAMADALPATAILRVNADLNVTTPAGEMICSLENALALLQHRVIPAFAISDSATATALGSWLKSNGLADSFVISANGDLIKQVRSKAPLCRGVLDFTHRDLSATTPSELRSELGSYGCRVGLFSASSANRDLVAALHNLMVAVWVESTAETDAAHISAIVTGANGIVTTDYNALADCYTKYFMPSTLIRAAGVIGHRGTPIYAQENTVESAILAVELGATLIEADFYLTKDNVVVGMHDATIDATTNGTGRVNSFTYAELCAYAVNNNTSVAPKPIPTLTEYCAALKGKNVRLLIEIKDSNTAICQYIVDIIEEYDMMDQANVISFDTAILEKMKEICPAMSVGFLHNNLSGSLAANEADPESILGGILGSVQQYDSTYNPQYSKIGPNLIRAAAHRGVLILPWTINSQKDFDTFFRYGAHAFTTDYTAWCSDYVQDLRTDKTTYITGTVGGSIPLSLNAIAYNGEVTHPTRATLFVVEQSGTLACTLENGQLKTSGTGSAKCLVSVSFFTASGTMYSKCTELFTVTVDPSHEESLAHSSWHWGNGAPTTVAETGAMYLDLDSGNVYCYTDGWALQGSLKGDAPTVEIRNGYWYVNGTATGVLAKGQNGQKGEDGADGEDGKNGLNGKDGKDGLDGKDATPDTAALSAANTKATVAIVIACVLLAANVAIVILYFLHGHKKTKSN